MHQYVLVITKPTSATLTYLTYFCKNLSINAGTLWVSAQLLLNHSEDLSSFRFNLLEEVDLEPRLVDP